MARGKGFIELELYNGQSAIISVDEIKRAYGIHRKKSTIYLKPSSPLGADIYHEVKNDFDNMRRQIKQARR